MHSVESIGLSTEEMLLAGRSPLLTSKDKHAVYWNKYSCHKNFELLEFKFGELSRNLKLELGLFLTPVLMLLAVAIVMVTYRGELLHLQIWRDHMAWSGQIIVVTFLVQDSVNARVI